MKVGCDQKTIGEVNKHGAIATLDYAAAHGLAGVFFRSVRDLSANLDPGELAEAKAHADELGLYLELGAGRVNPFNTALAPETRLLGDGDYRRGLEKMIRAARAIDCTELWAVTAGSQSIYPGYYAVDRFRMDAPWADQLQAIAKFLLALAPLLADLGCRLNLETHEEITTFELLRIIETVGPNVVGVTLDTGNLLVRGESPVAAVRRIAPYVHMTHAKDAILYFVPEGLQRQLRTCGQGVVDWATILPLLGQHSPRLHISIEDYRGLHTIQIYDPLWQQLHPDLTVAELADLVRLAKECEIQIASGDIMDPPDYQALPYGEPEKLASIQAAVAHLRGLIQANGLAD
jgi:sugar phosphate isomerase/epimerase